MSGKESSVSRRIPRSQDTVMGAIMLINKFYMCQHVDGGAMVVYILSFSTRDDVLATWTLPPKAPRGVPGAPKLLIPFATLEAPGVSWQCATHL